jgi:hypothetical protein
MASPTLSQSSLSEGSSPLTNEALQAQWIHYTEDFTTAIDAILEYHPHSHGRDDMAFFRTALTHMRERVVLFTQSVQRFRSPQIRIEGALMRSMGESFALLIQQLQADLTNPNFLFPPSWEKSGVPFDVDEHQLSLYAIFKTLAAPAAFLLNPQSEPLFSGAEIAAIANFQPTHSILAFHDEEIIEAMTGEVRAQIPDLNEDKPSPLPNVDHVAERAQLAQRLDEFENHITKARANIPPHLVANKKLKNNRFKLEQKLAHIEGALTIAKESLDSPGYEATFDAFVRLVTIDTSKASFENGIRCYKRGNFSVTPHYVRNAQTELSNGLALLSGAADAPDPVTLMKRHDEVDDLLDFTDRTGYPPHLMTMQNLSAEEVGTKPPNGLKGVTANATIGLDGMTTELDHNLETSLSDELPEDLTASISRLVRGDTGLMARVNTALDDDPEMADLVIDQLECSPELFLNFSKDVDRVYDLLITQYKRVEEMDDVPEQLRAIFTAFLPQLHALRKIVHRLTRFNTSLRDRLESDHKFDDVDQDNAKKFALLLARTIQYTASSLHLFDFLQDDARKFADDSTDPPSSQIFEEAHSLLMGSFDINVKHLIANLPKPYTLRVAPIQSQRIVDEEGDIYSLPSNREEENVAPPVTPNVAQVTTGDTPQQARMSPPPIDDASTYEQTGQSPLEAPDAPTQLQDLQEPLKIEAPVAPPVIHGQFTMPPPRFEMPSPRLGLRHVAPEDVAEIDFASIEPEIETEQVEESPLDKARALLAMRKEELVTQAKLMRERVIPMDTAAIDATRYLIKMAREAVERLEAEQTASQDATETNLPPITPEDETEQEQPVRTEVAASFVRLDDGHAFNEDPDTEIVGIITEADIAAAAARDAVINKGPEQAPPPPVKPPSIWDRAKSVGRSFMSGLSRLGRKRSVKVAAVAALAVSALGHHAPENVDTEQVSPDIAVAAPISAPAVNPELDLPLTADATPNKVETPSITMQVPIQPEATITPPATDSIPHELSITPQSNPWTTIDSAYRGYVGPIEGDSITQAHAERVLVRASASTTNQLVADNADYILEKAPIDDTFMTDKIFYVYEVREMHLDAWGGYDDILKNADALGVQTLQGLILSVEQNPSLGGPSKAKELEAQIALTQPAAIGLLQELNGHASTYVDTDLVSSLVVN